VSGIDGTGKSPTQAPSPRVAIEAGRSRIAENAAPASVLLAFHSGCSRHPAAAEDSARGHDGRGGLASSRHGRRRAPSAAAVRPRKQSL
jgi:hypothetical protein